jgi:hypothetical protein
MTYIVNCLFITYVSQSVSVSQLLKTDVHNNHNQILTMDITEIENWLHF